MNIIIFIVNHHIDFTTPASSTETREIILAERTKVCLSDLTYLHNILFSVFFDEKNLNRIRNSFTCLYIF